MVQVTVILKHMFTPDELIEEPSLKDDLVTDVTAECATMGAVDKVRNNIASDNVPHVNLNERPCRTCLLRSEVDEQTCLNCDFRCGYSSSIRRVSSVSSSKTRTWPRRALRR